MTNADKFNAALDQAIHLAKVDTITSHTLRPTGLLDDNQFVQRIPLVRLVSAPEAQERRQ